TLSFSEMQVPVAGLPIQVLRTYDSRDKHSGDFGVGWTLGLSNVRLQQNGRLAANWAGTVTSDFIPSYCVQPTMSHIVTITLPDGTVDKFAPVFNSQCQQLTPPESGTVSFQPLPGTLGSLAALGSTDVLVVTTGFPGPVEV